MENDFYRRHRHTSTRSRLLTALLWSVGAGTAASPAQAQPPSPAQVAQQLRDLDALDDASADVMRIETIGKSVQGREILLVRLARSADLPCVYVICRQHGDEAAPTQAALQLIRAFIENPERQELLGRVALCIVPIANPDGAEVYKRGNARGVNLNRDWGRQTQPETRAIAASIARSKAKIVIDAHENYPWEPWGAYVEPGRVRAAPGRTLLDRVTGTILRDVGPEHNLRRSGGASVNTLAHRHFAGRGIPSLLLESQQTSEGGDLDRRLSLHRDAIAATLRVVAASLPGIVIPQPSLVPPAQEPLPLLPDPLRPRTVAEYEATLGAPRLTVEGTSGDETRFYRAQNLPWLVLTRAADGTVRTVELRFDRETVTTWQDALRRIGVPLDGIIAGVNPDNSVGLRGIAGVLGEVRFVPGRPDAPDQAGRAHRLQIPAASDSAGAK